MIMVGDASFTAPPVRSRGRQRGGRRRSATPISGLPAIGPFGGRSKKVVFPAAEGCANVQVRMVASPGRVMPTERRQRGARCWTPPWRCSPASRSSTTSPSRASVKRPYWVRCFVVGGRARLIDPPISSLKET